MSNLNDVGKLMYLYLEQISPGQGTDAHEFIINATAQTLTDTGGRNWLPIVVKEIGEDQYEVIGNFFSYAVAEKAGLEKVWCVIAESNVESALISRLLAREVIPKINLSLASRDEIKSALEYLLQQPNSPLKGVQLLSAVSRIEEAPRQSWHNLEPITKLKCGINKGKKLQALASIFYLTPETKSDNVISDLSSEEVNNLGNKTLKELQAIAKSRGITGYSKLSKSSLIVKLTT